MRAQPVTRFLQCGDTALAVEFGDGIDRHVSALVVGLAEKLAAACISGVVEVVPTFRSLMIHYDPLLLPRSELEKKVAPLLSAPPAPQAVNRLWRLPACYDPSLAPDLAYVASSTGLTPEQVAERHSAVQYHVYMVGFLPGYPYMGDLPPELALPRRETPRTNVPAGSIAIATTLTAVYTLESPGGWHLIGRTPAALWDAGRRPPAILAAGDKVMFQPVPLGDYEVLAAMATAGELPLEPVDTSSAGACA
jgi:KipI family sensor histidine kinase inhibitor